MPYYLNTDSYYKAIKSRVITYFKYPQLQFISCGLVFKIAWCKYMQILRQ